MHQVLLAVALAVLVASTARAATLEVDQGARRTARAVRAGVAAYDLDGHVWLGPLVGVGGGRDTLVYVPAAIDRSRTIDVVIYMEGVGSFDDAAMTTRHVAAMARLAPNTVYVAPDAPSSTLGARDSGNEHWQAGCAARACPGGHAAPGDFLVFLATLRAHLATLLDADGAALDLRVSLIGFSRGGKGVLRALQQLADARFEVSGRRVVIADVIFADGNYLDEALDAAWAILAGQPDATLTILVGAGAFEARGGDGNRRRALAFWTWAAPDAPLPAADRAVSAPRLRLVPLEGGHHAIGDAAVDFLRGAARQIPTT